MKKLSWIVAVLLFVNLHSFAQSQYEISKDEKHPEQHILRGIINKYFIENDTSYKWYNTSKGYYNPDTATLNAFERAKGKVQFIVFAGTWCEDTQFILPKFFKLQEKSGITDDAITTSTGAIYDLVWKPLEKSLKGINNYFSEGFNSTSA